MWCLCKGVWCLHVCGVCMHGRGRLVGVVECHICGVGYGCVHTLPLPHKYNQPPLRYISESFDGVALHPIDIMDVATGHLLRQLIDPNLTTISPVNKPHPRMDVIISGSSRSLYAWRPLEEEEEEDEKQGEGVPGGMRGWLGVCIGVVVCECVLRLLDAGCLCLNASPPLCSTSPPLCFPPTQPQQAAQRAPPRPIDGVPLVSFPLTSTTSAKGQHVHVAMLAAMPSNRQTGMGRVMRRSKEVEDQ